ncbi:MAG: spermidine/putrescine ABC transporter substrate-binding protein [Ilumatobacteraceae bacterium]
MASQPEPIKILAPASFREKLSRRSLFQVGGAAAGFAVIATACGDDKKTSSDTSGSSGTGAGSDTTAAAGTAMAQASGDWSRVTNKASGTLAMYTWGDYNDPDIVGALAESDLGVSMKVDYYASNEDLITKLSTAGDSSGFDIVVPTGPFIPQMLEKGLLEKFDKSLLPNIVNVDPLYMGRDWDPSNEYSVCKDWGSTGYFWDTTQVSKDIVTWQDFMDVCMNEASGNCSILDSAPNALGMYFWANGINWTTEKKEDLDAAEAYLVDELASHIKAFDSYPSTALAEGSYAASCIWNGDARQAFVRVKDAGGNPADWKWALGSPATEIWMDNYCIAAGSPNAEAAHAWINWLLIPEISIKDLDYHGYNSGMKNMSQLISELLPNLVNGDMIFFSDEQVKSMQTGAVNTAQDRTVDIFDKMKAKASG